jgi:hypothetical protein
MTNLYRNGYSTTILPTSSGYTKTENSGAVSISGALHQHSTQAFLAQL